MEGLQGTTDPSGGEGDKTKISIGSMERGSIEGDDTDVVRSTGCTGRFSREGNGTANNTAGAVARVTHDQILKGRPQGPRRALSWARAC